MKQTAVAPVIEYLARSRDVVQAAIDDPDFAGTIAAIVDRLAVALGAGRKLLLAGNGGSAADAQHIAGEFLSRLNYDRAPTAAIALTTDSSVLTAIGNDYGYERVFARQLEGLAQKGDLLFAISTSGNSPNVLQAAQTARGLGCIVVAMTGERESKLSGHADPGLLIRAPSTVTARIQEVHTLCIHAIADSLDTLIRQRTAS